MRQPLQRIRAPAARAARRALAAETGATLYLGAAASAEFDFEPLPDGARLQLGEVKGIHLVDDLSERPGNRLKAGGWYQFGDIAVSMFLFRRAKRVTKMTI